MSVDKFGRTGTNYTSGVHHVGNFLPLTGGRLGGTLTMGANNIQFSTGDIHSAEDLSFLINSETKMVLRPNGVNVCDGKISNVALPTLASDAANKSYVDSFVGRFLPLTGGSLSGNLALGSNNIEFSTGDISSQEDLSFIINTEAKLVIRENGLDVCNKKLINVASPTLATDAANKTYVDSEVLQVRQVHRHAVDSCAESAISARVSQEDSERFANDAKTHADRAATVSTSAAPANPLQDKTYLLTFRNSAQAWNNADSWINQLTNTNLLMAGTRYSFVYDTTANSFQWVQYHFYKDTIELQGTDLQSHVNIRLKDFPANEFFGFDIYTEFSDGTVEKLSAQPWVNVWVHSNILYMKLHQNFPPQFIGKLFIHYIKCQCT
mgnify:CR=1 FL=1